MNPNILEGYSLTPEEMERFHEISQGLAFVSGLAINGQVDLWEAAHLCAASPALVAKLRREVAAELVVLGVAIILTNDNHRDIPSDEIVRVVTAIVIATAAKVFAPPANARN